jgi:hypothetical protein
MGSARNNAEQRGNIRVSKLRMVGWYARFSSDVRPP